MRGDVSIRQAGIGELDCLLRWRMEVLHAVFGVPEAEPMSALYAANEEYYRSALPDGSHVACFAEQDGGIIGCGGVCLFREMPSPDNPAGRCAYLMNVYTREAFRGAGVGRKIVSWLVEQARARNITKIYLESSGRARALYEGMGFVPMENYLMLGAGGAQ